ncbi:MAG: hypothetical protein ACREMX_18160, partial [Gemmatimonadales bacterium]
MTLPSPLRFSAGRLLLLSALVSLPSALSGQGVTTGAINGLVSSREGGAVADASIVALHVPTGTQYRAVTRSGGAYNI